MKRIATVALTVASLVFTLAPIAAGAALITRPDRDDARVITTAGTYTQGEADANAAAYGQLQDYVDQTEAFAAARDASAQAFIQAQQALMSQRDQESVAALNAKQETIFLLRARVFNLRAKVERKEAKIDELRAIIRDLRD